MSGKWAKSRRKDGGTKIMNKDTIELERKKHRKGYGVINDCSYTENDILNVLVDWSRNKNIRIYRHLLRIEEEDMPDMDNGQFGPIGGPYTEVVYPRCDRVKYLDIYYQ